MTNKEGFAKYISAPIVEVIVGQCKATFNVHKPLLCARSAYFEKCFKGGFAEAADGKVELLDIHPKVFEYFVKWLYTGDMAPLASCVGSQEIMIEMIDVYAFGDRIICTELQNRAVDLLQHAASSKTLQLATVIHAARTAPAGSKLSRYIARQFVRDMSVHEIGHYIGKAQWLEMVAVNPEFISQIITEMFWWGKGEKKWVKDPACEEGCQWHIHPDNSISECKRWTVNSFQQK